MPVFVPCLWDWFCLPVLYTHTVAQPHSCLLVPLHMQDLPQHTRTAPMGPMPACLPACAASLGLPKTVPPLACPQHAWTSIYYSPPNTFYPHPLRQPLHTHLLCDFPPSAMPLFPPTFYLYTLHSFPLCPPLPARKFRRPTWPSLPYLPGHYSPTPHLPDCSIPRTPQPPYCLPHARVPCWVCLHILLRLAQCVLPGSYATLFCGLPLLLVSILLPTFPLLFLWHAQPPILDRVFAGCLRRDAHAWAAPAPLPVV